MEIIVLLIAISLTLALVFLGIFFWNVRNGQYDDTYSPSVRILFDDEPAGDETDKKESNNKNK